MLEPFSRDSFPATAELRAVNRAQLIAAESHGFLQIRSENSTDWILIQDYSGWGVGAQLGEQKILALIRPIKDWRLPGRLFLFNFASLSKIIELTDFEPRHFNGPGWVSSCAGRRSKIRNSSVEWPLASGLQTTHSPLAVPQVTVRERAALLSCTRGYLH